MLPKSWATIGTPLSCHQRAIRSTTIANSKANRSSRMSRSETATEAPAVSAE